MGILVVLGDGDVRRLGSIVDVLRILVLVGNAFILDRRIKQEIQ